MMGSSFGIIHLIVHEDMIFSISVVEIFTKYSSLDIVEEKPASIVGEPNKFVRTIFGLNFRKSVDVQSLAIAISIHSSTIASQF